MLKRGRIGKKAQAEKIFMYAVALIIVGMILLFGYKAIAKLTKTSESATMAKFKNEIRNKIDIGSAYGRISTEDFETAVKYKSICFIAERDAKNLNKEFMGDYPLAADVAESEDNAFLYDGQTIEPFKVDPFEVDENSADAYGPDAICIPIVNGRFSLRLEGLGDRTLISS
ncbi:hypothetical protein COV19_03300 [Candidatus Woesearchaeota archaeon CG10_big_fil_rev_8_21_14_0_10_44_13]|nr:MAG: hypothetical protein COV19_03300 [Candidatus Woesearchaeota archaeon CG10_big_fil_rev_8_21_14_0_10_44_13]